jgi:hypothetical protein
MKTRARSAMRFLEKSVTNSKRFKAKFLYFGRWRRVKFFHITFFLAIALLTIPRFGAGATTGRFWSYFNAISIFNQNWSLLIMPGIRYEFARSDALVRPKNEFYFYELFTGPTYTKTWNRFTMQLPIWYYYMGFPSPDAYAYSHNIEFLPIFIYRWERFSLTSRTIFHNTIYASVYETSAQKKGYSLVIRQLLQLGYTINQRFSMLLAEEPFFGVIEDDGAPPSPIGFWSKGLKLNRLYAGFQYKITPAIVISPHYVLETAYDAGKLTDTNHYLFVTLSYTHKFF